MHSTSRFVTFQGSDSQIEELEFDDIVRVPPGGGAAGLDMQAAGGSGVQRRRQQQQAAVEEGQEEQEEDEGISDISTSETIINPSR